MAAIEAVGAAAGPRPPHHDMSLQRPGLSVKLSALHPRFEPGKEDRLAAELQPRLLTLLKAAEQLGLNVTIDAEEQDRLEPTLDAFGEAFTNPALANWHGLGIAVQAYGKRAVPILRWLRRLAERSGKRIPVRLVKGAYWDSEIKWAQERGLPDYPVLTRKLYTDVSYLACMRLLLSDPKAFYPQFATHNAHTAAAAYRLLGPGRIRVPAPARHGRGAVRGDRRQQQAGAPVPHLRARRRARGSARLSRAPLAGERRQHVVRQPPRRRRGADLADHSRSRGGGRARTRRTAAPRRSSWRARATSIWPERKNSTGLALTDTLARARLVAEMEAALEALVRGRPHRQR